MAINPSAASPLRYFLSTAFTVFFLWGMGRSVLAADGEPIIFSTAPTHTPVKTVEMYTPLIEFLSRVTGKQIELVPAKSFLEYTNAVRKGAYDLVFDGPHFVGWRMETQGHTPLVRLPGEIRIVVVIRDDSKLDEVGQLVGKKVCTFPSPNLLTMAFLREFTNPVRQPILIPVKGFKGLEECLRNGKGEAAVLRDTIWEKMDKTGLKLLYAPQRSYPERTFSAGPNVDTATQLIIKEALLSEEGRQAAQAILTTFKRKNFVAADPATYEDSGKLLSPIWGFTY